MGSVSAHQDELGLFVRLCQIFFSRPDHQFIIMQYGGLSPTHHLGRPLAGKGAGKHAALSFDMFRTRPSDQGDIRRDSLGKTVALILPNKVHAPHQHRLIPSRRQMMQKSRLGVGQGVHIGKDARVGRPYAGQHSHARGHAQRTGCIGLVETGSLPAQDIQVGRVHRNLGTAHELRRVLVAHEQEDIRMVHAFPSCGRSGSPW